MRIRVPEVAVNKLGNIALGLGRGAPMGRGGEVATPLLMLFLVCFSRFDDL